MYMYCGMATNPANGPRPIDSFQFHLIYSDIVHIIVLHDHDIACACVDTLRNKDG